MRCGGGLPAARRAAHVSICRGEGGEAAPLHTRANNEPSRRFHTRSFSLLTEKKNIKTLCKIEVPRSRSEIWIMRDTLLQDTMLTNLLSPMTPCVGNSILCLLSMG